MHKVQTGFPFQQSLCLSSWKAIGCCLGNRFNDHRKYGYEQAKKIIDFLKSEGCSVLVGVPTHWRTLTIDAVGDTRLHELIKQADIVHPWLVGRFDSNSYEPYRKSIEEDIKWCKANGKDYMPVLFPGLAGII